MPSGDGFIGQTAKDQRGVGKAFEPADERRKRVRQIGSDNVAERGHVVGKVLGSLHHVVFNDQAHLPSAVDEGVDALRRVRKPQTEPNALRVERCERQTRFLGFAAGVLQCALVVGENVDCGAHVAGTVAQLDAKLLEDFVQGAGAIDRIAYASSEPLHGDVRGAKPHARSLGELADALQFFCVGACSDGGLSERVQVGNDSLYRSRQRAHGGAGSGDAQSACEQCVQSGCAACESVETTGRGLEGLASAVGGIDRDVYGSPRHFSSLARSCGETVCTTARSRPTTIA